MLPSCSEFNFPTAWGSYVLMLEIKIYAMTSVEKKLKSCRLESRSGLDPQCLSLTIMSQPYVTVIRVNTAITVILDISAARAE